MIMKRLISVLFFICIVSCAQAQQVSGNIKMLLSSEGKVIFGDEPNSLVVIDYPENLQRVEQYLAAIDVPPRQVLIEARVVEVKLQNENSMGVNWQLFAEKNGFNWGATTIGSAYPGAPGALTQSLNFHPVVYPPLQSTGNVQNPFSIAIFDNNVNVILKAMASTMNTDILSAPRVATVNNRQAEIKVIEKLPWAEPQVNVTDSGAVTITWTIHFEEVGITLKALPTINEDGTITMTLTPEVSEKTGDYSLTVSQGSQSVPYTVPIIDKRTTSTKVIIGNGQTLIIGGLIKDKVIKGDTKIPILGDMPGIGYLFKSKHTSRDKTELLIFVSPTIITPNQFVRMEKEERYGLGREFIQEREREEQMAMVMEHQEKKSYEKLASQLDELTQRQERLIAERKKIEADVDKRSQNLKSLQEARDALTDKRKQLQQSH